MLISIEDELGYDAEDIDRDNIAARLKQDAVSFSNTFSYCQSQLISQHAKLTIDISYLKMI